jgi:hypothetical protein
MPPSRLAFPYVSVAAFCQRVEQHADGTLTLHRIVDTFTADPPGKGTPYPTVEATAVVTLVTGPPFGSHTLAFRVTAPTGASEELASFPVHTTAAESLAGRVLPIVMPVSQQGDYWFDVIWDDQTVTRMRLRIVFMRKM